MSSKASLLAGAVILVASCAATGGGAHDSTALTPTSSTVATSPLTGDAVLDPFEMLAEAREQWDAAGPTNYRYVVEADCECSLGGHLDVEVVDEMVAEVVRLDAPGRPYIDPEVGHTVEDLFSLIEEGLTGAESVDVEYADHLGYPARILIVWNAQADDGTLEASITSFQPRD